jgi:hypothetical protein
LKNSIIYNNSAPAETNYAYGILQYCCTTPLAAGPGNFTNAPIFIDEASGNFRLQTNSPCINGGNNLLAIGSVDLDGHPRIFNGTVDIGAYESQVFGSLISYVWLQQYGLPTDGSADALDPDSDGMNNWQEYLSGTNPTNAGSVFRITSSQMLSSTQFVLRWSSVSNRLYDVTRASDLTNNAPFVPLTAACNLPASPPQNVWTDSVSRASAPSFYRVTVHQ